MATNYGNLTGLALCILLLAIIKTVSPNALLTLVHEKTSVAYTNSFYFTESQYSQFYDCLCGEKTTKCNFEYDTDTTLHRPVLQLETVSQEPGDRNFSNYYQCLNNALMSFVNCTRLAQDEVTCNQAKIFTPVPRPDTASCKTECTGFLWFSANQESLAYNSTRQNLISCDSNCYQPPPKTTEAPTTTTTFRPSTREPTTRVITTTSPPTTSQTESTTIQASLVNETSTGFKDSKNDTTEDYGDDDSDSTAVIIGVVVGILLVIVLIVVIAVVVYYRRIQGRKEAARARARRKAAGRGHKNPSYSRQTSSQSNTSRKSGHSF